MRKLSHIKLILSDWSGVISDDRLPVYEANARMMESYGHERLTYEEWIRTAKGNPVDFFRSLGITCERDELYARYQSILPQVRNDGIHPIAYAEAKAFYESFARDRTIIVISSHPTPFLETEAIEYGVRDFIHVLHGSEVDKASAIRRMIRKEGVFFVRGLVSRRYDA